MAATKLPPTEEELWSLASFVRDHSPTGAKILDQATDGESIFPMVVQAVTAAVDAGEMANVGWVKNFMRRHSGERLTEYVTFQLTGDQLERLDALVDLSGESRSQFIRDAVMGVVEVNERLDRR